MRISLENYFGLADLGTTVRQETVAGATTFLTMAYIVLLNPAILSDAGMPAAAVATATCLAAAIGSTAMGVAGRYPIALAPGMGLNAYFTYSVVIGMGVAWQTALGAVFLSGALFFLLTIIGIQQKLVEAIPRQLYSAIGVGIGLFIAFIGLRNAGLVVANPATFVALGDLTAPGTLAAIAGLLLMAALTLWRVTGALAAGILLTAVGAHLAGAVQVPPSAFTWDHAFATAGQLDIPAALELGLLEIVFVFWFIDVFDNVGTLVAVGGKAKLFDAAEGIPRLRRILLIDSSMAMVSAGLGTSTTVNYVESASGVAAGGRSGLTAVVAGILFLLALFVVPFVGWIPAVATAPALVIVGALMMGGAKEIDWDDTATAIPAFLTVITIPLTYSIANGLAIGFVAHLALEIAAGRARQVHWLVYLLGVLFVLRFAYLGGE